MEESGARRPTGGEITKLTVQKNDPERMSVFIEGEFAFGVHQNLVIKHRLHAGRVLTPEEQQAIVEADRVAKAKVRALDYLAYKPRTEFEVRRKLQQKDYDAPVIEQVVAYLHDRGYLDDVQYAEEYVQRRFSNKGYGPVRLQEELRRRGIDRALAERAIDDLFAEENELAAAREAAEKNRSRLAREEDPRKRRDKLYRYLRRRGYTYDAIRQVIDEVEAREA